VSIYRKSSAGLFYLSIWILKSISRTFGVYEQPSVVSPPMESKSSAGSPVLPKCFIVFSDTDNDISSVENTLRFAGLLNGNGELTDNLQGTTILHTGDFLDKKDPDNSVAEYWQSFQQYASVKGCQVKLIVGNHEQQIWQKIKAGEQYGKNAEQTRRLNSFVEGLDLFYVSGSVLFIHGYPTLEFLQALLHFREVTGKDLNCFNTDHYRKAFKSINALRQYSYVKGNRQANYLLYDVADASRYYKKKGRMVGAVLAELKIGIVVHGHRPQRTGVQVDYEFCRWIPEVRMIGNDTMVKRKGIGATIIRETSEGDLDIVFINKKTESNELRRKIQEDFWKPPVSFDTNRSTDPETAGNKFAAQG